MPAKAKDLTAWVTDYHVWRKQAHGAWHERLQSNRQRDDATEAAQRELAQLRAAEVKLRVGEKTRQLLPRKDVVDAAGRAVQTVRTRLNALVQKMTGRLANVPDHVVSEELQAEVDDICNAFARGMSKTLEDVTDTRCPFCDGNK